MPKLLHWCDEASVLHWQQDDPTVPDTPEAHRRVVAEGRLSKVLHPSPAHAAKRMEAKELNPRFGRRLEPAAQRT